MQTTKPCCAAWSRRWRPCPVSRRSRWAARAPAARRRPHSDYDIGLYYRARPADRRRGAGQGRGRPRRSRRRGIGHADRRLGTVDRRRRLAGGGRRACRPALSRSRPRRGCDRRRPCRQGRALLSARPSARLPAHHLHGRGGLRPSPARSGRRARQPAAPDDALSGSARQGAARALRMGGRVRARQCAQEPRSRRRRLPGGLQPSVPSPVSARPCSR